MTGQGEGNGAGRWRALGEEVKARLDYREFYGRYCPAVTRHSSGAGAHALCPIPSHAHSGKGSPGLSVGLRRGFFHCFSREEGGDAVSFYALMHVISPGQALREMARELGIKQTPATTAGAQLPLKFRAAPDEPAALEPLGEDRLSAVCELFLEACRGEEQGEGVNYLARRGIDALTMIRAGVVYFPRRAYRRVMRRMLDSFTLEELQRSGLFNSQEHLTFYHHRLLFPFYVEGRAVYLQARATASGVEPRWHNMRGVVPTLYNSDALAALPSGVTVFLVEGFTDTLTLAAHNFAAIGIAGAGGFREEWLAPLARFRVVSALDPDSAGERAGARYRELFAARGLHLARLRLPCDVNDFFRRSASAPLDFALLAEAALEEAEEGL